MDIITTLNYWIGVSTCDCNLERPIGGCLKCDLIGIRDALEAGFIPDPGWAQRIDAHPLPAPHSRGVERDRDLFRAGYESAIEDYLKAKKRGDK